MQIFSYRVPNFSAQSFIFEESEYILVISPGPFDGAFLSELKAKNKELIFVAPNNFHHLHIGEMKKQFPEASFYGPKRAQEKSQVKLEKTSQLNLEEFEKVFIAGLPALSETCFYHKNEKVLVATDLFFNMQHEMKFFPKLIFKLFGTYKKLAISRLIKIMIKDKKQFKASIEQISQLDFEWAYPNHGEKISKAEFMQLFKQYQ